MLYQAAVNRLCLVAICTGGFSGAIAETGGLSADIGVHVYPREGQDQVQQSKDEAHCYGWAIDRTGTDPFELERQASDQARAADQAMAQAQSAGQGTTGRSAAGGAVAGALIGGIFGRGRRSGLRGAAIGGTTGAIVGSSQESQARSQASQQVAGQSAQMQSRTEAQIRDFKTAFATCLEATDYIAKF